jgi:hypothetical protein
MLHDYAEFNKFVNHGSVVMQATKTDGLDNIQPRLNKEVVNDVGVIALGLESTHAALSIAITNRDEVRTVENLERTLRLLEELERRIEMSNKEEEEVTELLYTLGIDYIYSTVERIIRKGSHPSKARQIT